jgi:hypothetical protein
LIFRPGCLLFDGGSAQDYLTNVKTFFDVNPNEVLTLLFTNPEGVLVSTVWNPAFDAAGASPLFTSLHFAFKAYLITWN